MELKQVTFTLRGVAGQVIQAAWDADGNCISGDEKSVIAYLDGAEWSPKTKLGVAPAAVDDDGGDYDAEVTKVETKVQSITDGEAGALDGRAAGQTE